MLYKWTKEPRGTLIMKNIFHLLRTVKHHLSSRQPSIHSSILSTPPLLISTLFIVPTQSSSRFHHLVLFVSGTNLREPSRMFSRMSAAAPWGSNWQLKYSRVWQPHTDRLLAFPTPPILFHYDNKASRREKEEGFFLFPVSNTLLLCFQARRSSDMSQHLYILSLHSKRTRPPDASHLFLAPFHRSSLSHDLLPWCFPSKDSGGERYK